MKSVMLSAIAIAALGLANGAQAQQVFDLMRQNPNAQAQMRAPIFEEKVVDFLVELAEITDKPVSREELFKEDEA